MSSPRRNILFLRPSLPESNRSNIRLRAIRFLSVGILVVAMPARAALLAYEPFANAAGTALIGSADGFGFNGAWQSNSSQGVATNTAVGLSYTDGLGRQLVTSDGAGFFQGLTTANNNMQPVRLFNFSRGTNGTDGVTTWISFVVVRQGPTGTLAGNAYGRGANVPHDINTGGIQKLAIGNSSGVGSNTVALIPTGSAVNCRGAATSTFGGATNFVVVRIDHVAGGNDHAYLFVNPTLGVEPATSSAGAVWTNSFDFSFDRLRIFAGGQASAAQPYAELIVDEYRLGESYADVTPYEGAPPVVGLQITNIQTSGGQVLVSGIGGTAGGTYQLLAGTDLGVASSNWSAVATNTFDGSGNFSLTTALQAGNKFFRVRTAAPAGPIGPTWLSQPVSLTVTQGQTAVFSASADGTAPLTYQWYYNTNTLLSGQSGTELTLTNVQGTNVGSYAVRVSNAGGNITSTQATLIVLTPPGIVTQPQSQSVVESNNVTFTVLATGTAPLSYQWYYNTNTTIPTATNASYMLTNVATNQAGTYHVRIANPYGSATSAVANLTVIPASSYVDFSHVGFAANGITLTGGAAGPTVYVGSEAELQAYSDVNAPYTIIITNSFNLTSMDTHIRNNKTVIGSNNVVLSGGGLYLYDATNVIIRNLTITGSPEDGIGLHYSEHVWIDHCTITDSDDGAIDITQESDNVTISWCHIYYSSPNLEHRLASLIASSDADTGTYRTTYHHNWFGTNCQERLPSVRFGRAHVFNNYYNAPGNNYCVRTRKEAECLVENNFFHNVQNPWEQYITGSGDVQGKLSASGNNVSFLGTTDGVNWTGNQIGSEGSRLMIPGTDTVFAPPYAYTPDPVALVPSLVTTHAGAGRGPFAP
jgi:pectate lyase